MSVNRFTPRGQKGNGGRARRTPGSKKSRHNDVSVLAALHGQAPLKLRQIVEQTRIPYQAADRTLSSLCSQGHVVRTEDGTRGNDGKDRGVYSLTAAGRLYCAALGIARET